MKPTEVLEKIGSFELHSPVLLREILDIFSVFQEPAADLAELRYLDGTFGRGGHFRSLKMMLPTMKAVALDQDPEAVEFAKKKFSPLVQSGDLNVIHRNFSNFSELNPR